MEHRQENRERDERLDQEIDRVLAGDSSAPDDTLTAQLAREFARLAAEQAPRLSNAARAQGLNALRARAAQRRARRRRNPFHFLSAVPRWAALGATILIAVLIANGVSTAAAESLPGSWWYPFKRFGENSQLWLQTSHEQRAQLWMNLANTRLDEVQRLLANGARVDPAALDAVDTSILQVLAELGGTRGAPRVELLKKLTALALRQQQILEQLAQNASPLERARFEQTAKLLQGVARYAQSPNAVQDPTLDPMRFLTPSPTPTQLPTVPPTSVGAPSPTALETVGASVSAATQTPDAVNTLTAEPAATRQALPTTENDVTETPDDDETETPDDDETETPDGDETETPDDDETETPEPSDEDAKDADDDNASDNDAGDSNADDGVSDDDANDDADDQDDVDEHKTDEPDEDGNQDDNEHDQNEND
ncbi:hypothetical protein FBQ82_14695 [Anaerolineae bacterium CFX7]|nr:hypothetical protein [Anaerolineae bacterium CFX7]